MWTIAKPPARLALLDRCRRRRRLKEYAEVAGAFRAGSVAARAPPDVRRRPAVRPAIEARTARPVCGGRRPRSQFPPRVRIGGWQ
jgi:hypothetical protein